MYALVRTGGKQYRVEEGKTLRVDRLPGEPGATVELGEVLLMADGDAVTVGAPTIDGARVLATVAEQGRDRKVVVFRYKAKTRSRKKTGHRQHFTRLVVDDILAPGQAPKPRQAAEPEPEPAPEAQAPKGRRARRAKPAAGAAPDETGAAAPMEMEAPAVAEAAGGAPEPATSEAAAEEKPKRRRRKAE